MRKYIKEEQERKIKQVKQQLGIEKGHKSDEVYLFL